MSETGKRPMTIQEEMDYEMRPEYEFSKGIRNPYPERARARAADALTGLTGYVVAIEPELFEKFPRSEAVNEALRDLLKMREQDAA